MVKIIYLIFLLEKGEDKLESLKLDGYFFRSPEEDIKYEEFEKSNKNIRKTVKIKK
jgi:hypothetical protein